jgi:hypothetical protein
MNTGWHTTNRTHDIFYAVNEHSPWDTIMVSSAGRWTYFSGYPNRYDASQTAPYAPSGRDLQHAIAAVFAEWRRFQ